MKGELGEVVAAAQAGDEQAFRFLYRSLQPFLLRYLTALVGGEVEDVASETWLYIAGDLICPTSSLVDSGVGGGDRPEPGDGPFAARVQAVVPVPVDELGLGDWC